MSTADRGERVLRRSDFGPLGLDRYRCNLPDALRAVAEAAAPEPTLWRELAERVEIVRALANAGQRRAA